jgi:hypothetical protein
MNTRLAALLASLLLASTGPALAAEPAAATKLAQLLLPKATWSQGIDQLGKVVQMQMQGHPGSQPLQYPPDFDAKVRAELEKVLPYDDLVAIHAKELAGAYTPAELDSLVAFYGAPLGQKTLQKNAEVSDKVSQATQQRVQSKMPEVMKRLATFAKPSATPSGHPTTGGMPAGHPPMGGSDAAPAKKAATSDKGAAKAKAKGDASKAKAKGDAATAKAQGEAAAPKADSNAAAPKADVPAAPKAEADAAAPKAPGDAPAK